MELKNKMMSSATGIVKHHPCQDKQDSDKYCTFSPLCSLEVKVIRGSVRGEHWKTEGTQFGKNRDWEEGNRGERWEVNKTEYNI